MPHRCDIQLIRLQEKKKPECRCVESQQHQDVEEKVASQRPLCLSCTFFTATGSNGNRIVRVNLLGN